MRDAYEGVESKAKDELSQLAGCITCYRRMDTMTQHG